MRLCQPAGAPAAFQSWHKFDEADNRWPAVEREVAASQETSGRALLRRLRPVLHPGGAGICLRLVKVHLDSLPIQPSLRPEGAKDRDPGAWLYQQDRLRGRA